MVMAQWTNARRLTLQRSVDRAEPRPSTASIREGDFHHALGAKKRQERVTRPPEDFRLAEASDVWCETNRHFAVC